MNRTFRFSPLWILLFFAGGLISCSNQNRGDQKNPALGSRPNIIYILADDLGYGDLGAYGGQQIETPNLDGLSEEGIRFTQHYSGSTVCAPARSVLMTGLHTGHTPIRGNREILPIGQHPLPEGTLTLARVLKDAGYATGAFGKWGLGGPESEGLPSLQGFDHFFGFLDQRRAHFYYPEFLFRDLKGRELERVSLDGNITDDDSERSPGSGRPIEAVQYAPEVMQREALAFIEEHREVPFFLYLPMQLPHASLEVPDEFLQIYLDENGESIFDEEPTPQGHYVNSSMPKAAYAAMVTFLDHQVGELIGKLDELNIADHTLVLFTSDNGSYAEGGYHYSMLNSNAPFRGGKRDLYEGGIRVPLIARWPSVVAGGQMSPHISGFQDIMPTFAELAGAKVPADTDGISLLPTLTGGGEQQEHDYLYWEFHEQGGKQAVRKGDWKAVRLNVRENPDSPLELYHLAEDPGETTNVAEEHPEIVREMERLIREAHLPSEVFPLGI
ncbi:MAG TPA: arylsulfatase [Balneolaceae bacterium]|nr:arylsulfatase [Balneolaceae bacterium]